MKRAKPMTAAEIKAAADRAEKRGPLGPSSTSAPRRDKGEAPPVKIEMQPMAWPIQCKAITRKGERCKNWAINRAGFCDTHILWDMIKR